MKQTRRQFLGTLLAGGAAIGGASYAAASSGMQLPSWGGDTGKQKAGPLGLNSGQAPSFKGEIPVALIIPDADVDAEVERTKIVDGQMLDPSGPWIVAWYEATGRAGETNNMVMSGHIDYWDVGPAVFRNVASLKEGAEITVQGEGGGTFTYAMEYLEQVEVANLPQEKLNELVGRTDYPALTLITCGGQFNYDTGEYPARDIIRARLLDQPGGEPVAAETGAEAETAAPTETSVAESLPTGLVEGGAAVVVNDSVNVRSEATTSSEVVTVFAVGVEVTITGPSVEADGYTWWPVTSADGFAGWVVQDYLEPAPAE